MFVELFVRVLVLNAWYIEACVLYLYKYTSASYTMQKHFVRLRKKMRVENTLIFHIALRAFHSISTEME